jgi:hypothetical protein
VADQKTIWKHIHASFKGHMKRGVDLSEQMALDRVAAKCIHRDGLSFNESNCLVREEMLTLDQLEKLKRHHQGVGIHRLYENQPIIVLIFESNRIVIDGNHRVNTWVQQQSTTPRFAFVIEPKDPKEPNGGTSAAASRSQGEPWVSHNGSIGQ